MKTPIDPHAPAFPVTRSEWSPEAIPSPGMSIRARIATTLLAGLFTNSDNSDVYTQDGVIDEAVEFTDALIARLNREDGDMWKPMESAPKDGTVFLAFCPHEMGGYQFSCTCGTDGAWRCMMSGDVQKPTRWQTSPPNPTGKESA